MTYIPDAADLYEQHERRQEERRPPSVKCDICGEEIHMENDLYEQDDAYEIDGYTICGECIQDYIKNKYYKQLRAG